MPKGKTLTDAEKAEREAAKRAKFKELAQKRLPKVKAALMQIANLASYSPSDAQKEFIMKELGEYASIVNAAFQGKKTASEIVVPD